ncbi:MAG TPA: tRNA preQ1(34) S-adenosylmethionine ribosyltransferase-isomerase QueA [Candidatus Omnitrophota bacterium]|nr:tRNA preQ1(34) S-adenosylmethionine ribosyltransferase-isomerase QueA [Candidatus Omnitrophota bacterium]
MPKLSDFDYELPKELIAQLPLKNRAQARLLVLSRETGSLSHRRFEEITDYFSPGDCLVLNNTKVLPARLFGRKDTGGRVEVLLHKTLGDCEWEVLLKPSGRVKAGSILSFGSNGASLHCEVKDSPRKDSGLREVEFLEGDQTPKLLRQLGHIPLPPYIDRPDSDIDRELYQTIFAEIPGAVASPTAGLHFDEMLIRAIREKGVKIFFVTLHVGYGTFQPVAEDEISRHEMHPEVYEISEETAQGLTEALGERRRVIACGTTVARALETVVREEGNRIRIRPGSGETRIFIHPPYSFKAFHGLITNFHLPRTTLLMLVSAFAGAENIFRAYREAIRERYRFYSYGDAMLII